MLKNVFCELLAGSIPLQILHRENYFKWCSLVCSGRIGIESGCATGRERERDGKKHWGLSCFALENCAKSVFCLFVF